jgi:hypothetical protein
MRRGPRLARVDLGESARVARRPDVDVLLVEGMPWSIGPAHRWIEEPEVFGVETRADQGVLSDRIDLHPRHSRCEEMGIETNDRLPSAEEDLVDVHVEGGQVARGVRGPERGAEPRAQLLCDLQSSGVDITAPRLEIEHAMLTELSGRCVLIGVGQFPGDPAEQVLGLVCPRPARIGGVIASEARPGARRESCPQRNERCDDHADAGPVRHGPSRAPVSTPHQSRTAIGRPGPTATTIQTVDRPGPVTSPG